MTEPIETTRICPHPDEGKYCPRCGGDGFYTVFADPLRAPGTDEEPVVATIRTRAEFETLAAGWIALLFAAFIAFVVVLAAAWILSAPRSSSDPTAPQSGASGAVTAPGGDGVPARAPVGASGRSSSGAPRETVDTQQSTGGAPLPAQGKVGGSIAVGKASWCAPKGKYCRGWGGHSILAASPNWDGHPYWAKVCRQDWPKVCATVYVHSVCACGTGKVIDLTVYVFRDLLGGRLHEDGVIDVTVRGVRAPALPATDTAP